MRPGVIDLMDHYDVVAMAFVGDPPEVRDDPVVLMKEIAADQPARAMGGDRLDHDHCGAAPGSFPVVSKMAVSRQPLIAHVGRVGAENNAVL